MGVKISVKSEVEFFEKVKEDLYFLQVKFFNLSYEQKKLLTSYFFNTLVPDLFEKDFNKKQDQTLKIVREEIISLESFEKADIPQMDYLKHTAPTLVPSQSSI